MKNSATGTCFFVSDATADLGEMYANTVLQQFEGYIFQKKLYSHVRTPEMANHVLRAIQKAANDDGVRPILFLTIRDAASDAYQIIAQSDALIIDLHNPITKEIDAELKARHARDPRYHVSISFAGEDRATAKAIAMGLRAKNIRVFFDEFAKPELLGKDLYQYLFDIYSARSACCIVLVSEHYASKAWTKHELKAMQSAALLADREYILPLRLDDTPLPGLPAQIGYLDLRRDTIESAVDAVEKKLASFQGR